MMAFAANSIRTLLVSSATTQIQRSSIYQFPLLLRRRLYCSRRNVVEILEERGLLESLTSDALRRQPDLRLRVYCGFDPTAESLHLGNLLGIIVLSWFLRCGHHVVALVGGATGRVGDPSGKSLERPELDPLSLDRNVSAISATIRSILGRDDSSPSSSVSVLNNYEWWKDVKLLDFLRDVGRFARVGAMMSKESVRKRLESEQQGMSYTEFTYQLLQGYDFLRLFRDEGVNIQIGGTDQWGNITAGTDLIRRIILQKTKTKTEEEGGGGGAAAAYGLTFPLLLKSDGTKFGKSEDGAIWLSSSLLSPYQFYQYFFSISDADVVRFLKILTFLSIDEISQIEREMQDAPPNTAQRRLAEEVTRFVHGLEGLEEALKATEALRPGGGGAETKLDWKTIEAIAEDVPSFTGLRQDQIVYQNVLLASDSSTLEQLKELSSKRKPIEESINENSHVTEAIAREMSGGLTSRCEQDIQKLEHYLPLLENLVNNINVRFKNHQEMACWISNLKIRWSSVLNSSSIFHLKCAKFHQVNDIHFELGMSLFLYGAMLRDRALEVLSSDLVQSATLFRKAAGVYDYLAKEVHIFKSRGEDRIPEATSNISSIMSLVCLADAQALTARKSEDKGNSGALLAKLHYGITEFLSEAIEMLQATIKDCKDISSRLMVYITSCKTLHELKCCKHFAENLKNEGKIGVAVGVLGRELSSSKKSVPKDETWNLVFKQVVDDLSVVLRKYDYENEFVWNEKVPSKYELPNRKSCPPSLMCCLYLAATIIQRGFSTLHNLPSGFW